ncbi:SDR family NAD(P)-dependent oxidoreductase [Arthrobacter sp.]|uniref:SDR family NAD(P)-dependent oxidoreductase n=1 Tax=Arthrobacter sp. TaxID=1667 RepID=UPI0026E05BFA|nr:SDR family NAD(P)-dependent oxidoreductase [Arthrobacter sp.]MDO5751716.1 SDR family NAD(P)-dependent oxidoreductase [Arthrobacter sp.]
MNHTGQQPTPQQPLASGFGHYTAAAAVVEGMNLSGCVAIVTGGYSGLGLETVRALASVGVRVYVPARRPDHARGVLAAADLGGVEVFDMDLGVQASVKEFAREYVATGNRLDILINNAAIMACPETRVGPGWEAQFATNHLGHFTLVNELWPVLADGGARVVALSSTGHKVSGIHFDDPQFTRGYDKWQAYGQAKTANSLFAVELDAKGTDYGVRAFAVNPGGIMTGLQRHLTNEEMVAAGWMDDTGKLKDGFKSAEQGAATSVWAATSPLLDGRGGVYCEDCDIASPTDPESEFARFAGVDEHAVDPDSARRLWTLSAELTGVNAFG